MTKNEKDLIMSKAKTYFKENIIDNHIRNTKALSLESFKPNPFLQLYLAEFAFGDISATSQAKALIYPRVLGTSITTTFGNAMQGFCHNVLPSYASTTSGMDIEFIDCIDGNKKYCQLKAGPSTINSKDVDPILRDFKNAKNLARTNGLRIPDDDFIVGIIYGTKSQLGPHYKKIQESYPVYIGEEFWTHLTGDSTFYSDLIKTMKSLVDESGCKEILDSVIKRVAKELES